MARSSRRTRHSADRPRRSVFVRILRAIVFAILFAFLVGFVVGTFLRRDLDRPVRYMGERVPASVDRMLGSAERAGSVAAADPGDIRHALSGVLVPRHDEEQIG